MIELAIKAENISKQYRLGEVGTGTLSHDLNRFWYKIRGREDPYLKIGEINDRSKIGSSNYVWSLKDINFEIEKGDAVGIIGRNGAGKSTLLKLLSKVTKPTTGSFKVNGRIASLLEVGTGFNPEMTGRENIYMNGAILGMRRFEITRKFDEIVAFSGVEKYIDTPVKRYSSGMYVRLAFAVAAHLESEILIVDEVLAVGDAEFQKKCLGKMKDASAGEGRTVLFVSHNMAAVKALCNKGIVLQQGKLVMQGSATDAVTHYLRIGETETTYEHKGSLATAIGNHNIRVLKMNVKPLSPGMLTISSGFKFFLEFYNEKEDINLDVTFEIVNQEELKILHNGTVLTHKNDSKTGIYQVSGQIDPFILNAGAYKFNLIFGENQRYALFVHEDIISFEIENEVLGSNASITPGIIRLDIPFTTSFRSIIECDVC